MLLQPAARGLLSGSEAHVGVGAAGGAGAPRAAPTAVLLGAVVARSLLVLLDRLCGSAPWLGAAALPPPSSAHAMPMAYANAHAASTSATSATVTGRPPRRL